MMATPLSSPFSLTGDAVIDAATNGYYWQLGADRTIRWSLSNGWSGEYWTNPTAAVQQLSVLFSNISYYANVKFQYAGYFQSPATAATASDINITFDATNITKQFANVSSWAFGDFSNAALNSWYPGAPGDIYVNLNSEAAYLPSYAPGTQGYFLFLHEILHTVGLKHPHDDGGTGRPTFKSLGWSGLDDDWFTVMSYNDDSSWNIFGWDPATPMAIDVLALQYLYGKNTATNAGDTTYSLSLTDAYATVWDASGNDTINVTNSTAGWDIELPILQPSKLVDTKVGIAVPLNELTAGAIHTLYWLTGDIENVWGSAYADRIFGSSGNNYLYGGGGNDYIDGKGGFDAAGYLGIRSNYTVTKSGTTLTVSDKTGAEGTDTLLNISELIFKDVVTTFDSSGLAGEAYRLYQAAFNRKADAAGLGWQISALVKGSSLLQIAQNFMTSAEFQGLYGKNQSTESFVSHLYNNVLHRVPQQFEIDFWSNIIDKGNPVHQSTAEVLLSFSESAENQAQVIGSIQNGIDYVYYA